MKHSSLIIPFFLALLFCACDNSVPDYGVGENPVFRIIQDTMKLSVGQTASLSISVPLSEVEWASSADSVASVDFRGIVTARAEGSAWVIASRLFEKTSVADSLSSGATSTVPSEVVLASDSCMLVVIAAE